MTRSPAEGGVEVTVLNRIFLGEHTDYRVRHPALGEISVLVPGQTERETRPPAKGELVWIAWGGAARILTAD